jgi:hypothetical protein
MPASLPACPIACMFVPTANLALKPINLTNVEFVTRGKKQDDDAGAGSDPTDDGGHRVRSRPFDSSNFKTGFPKKS